MNKTAKQIAEAVIEKCETPGEKLRSKGKGRGLAKGKGKGPIGIPVGDKTAGYDYLDAILVAAEKRANFDMSAQQPDEQPMRAEQSMQQPGQSPQGQSMQAEQSMQQPGQSPQEPVGPYVDPGQAGEQRRGEVHQQQMQFANDKHQLELQEMQMGMSHSEQDAQLKSDQAQQKAQIQNTKDQEQMQIEQQHRQMQQQAAAQQQAAYSQNIGAMGGEGQPPQ